MTTALVWILVLGTPIYAGSNPRLVDLDARPIPQVFATADACESFVSAVKTTFGKQKHACIPSTVVTGASK